VKIGSSSLYLPSTILHNAWHPKTAQHSKLINVKCRPIHEKCKTKLITYKQQRTKKLKSKQYKDTGALKASR
jgi:hypothetical protein